MTSDFCTLKMEFSVLLILGSVEGREGRNARVFRPLCFVNIGARKGIPKNQSSQVVLEEGKRPPPPRQDSASGLY